MTCCLYPICFCLYCLNTTRPSYRIHSALGWQIFKGNSYISKWHKQTETCIIICFSFPVPSRDLWTCGSCKSFAASGFYLQYLLANLLWWKNVGGSSIHGTSPIWSSLFSSLTPVGSYTIRLSWPPISTTSRLGNINRLKVWNPRKLRAPGCQNAQLSFTNSQVNKVKYNTPKILTLVEHTHHIYVLMNHYQPTSGSPAQVQGLKGWAPHWKPTSTKVFVKTRPSLQGHRKANPALCTALLELLHGKVLESIYFSQDVVGLIWNVIESLLLQSTEDKGVIVVAINRRYGRTTLKLKLLAVQGESKYAEDVCTIREAKYFISKEQIRIFGITEISTSEGFPCQPSLGASSAVSPKEALTWLER